MVGREVKRAASVAAAAHVRVWGQHTCTSTWLHGRPRHARGRTGWFVAQVCAVHASGRVHTCVCPSQHHRAHTSLMETPGLQLSRLAVQGPRPERSHHRLAPLKGTRKTQGPGEAPPGHPCGLHAELWGGPSQGRVYPGSPEAPAQCFPMQRARPPCRSPKSLGVPGGGGGLLQGLGGV